MRRERPTTSDAIVPSATAAPAPPPVGVAAPDTLDAGRITTAVIEPPAVDSAGPIVYPSRGEPRRAGPGGETLSVSAGCTAPQLRRFIKSRPYVPMHELRRRFGINGQEDDVTAVDLVDGRIFVGLPTREGGLLGELLRGGEVGYELSLDPRSPIVVGLYPMRPVPRS